MGSQGERWMRQPQWEMPSATGQGRDRSSRNLPTEAATEGSGGAVRTPTPPGRNGQREGLWGPPQHQALPPRPPSPQCTQRSSLLSPAQRESHHQESSGTSKHCGEKQQQEGPRGGGNGGRNGLWRDRRDSRAGGGRGVGSDCFQTGKRRGRRAQVHLRLGTSPVFTEPSFTSTGTATCTCCPSCEVTGRSPKGLCPGLRLVPLSATA